MINPHLGWIGWALLSAVAGAALATLTKAGIKHIEPAVALAVQSLFIVAISWSVLAWQGQQRQLASIDRSSWFYLILAGIVTSASYLCLFRAVKLGNVSQVIPVDRLSLVFAMILGALFLKERITGTMILGGGLMAAGAMLIALTNE